MLSLPSFATQVGTHNRCALLHDCSRPDRSLMLSTNTPQACQLVGEYLCWQSICGDWKGHLYFLLLAERYCNSTGLCSGIDLFGF